MKSLHSILVSASCAGLLLGCSGDAEPTSGCGDAVTRPALTSETESAGVDSNRSAPVAPVSDVDVCGKRFDTKELAELLEGSLIVAARHREYGFTPAQAAIGFALELAENGIDFGALGRGTFEFEGDAYVYRNGDAVLGVRFVLLEDVGGLKTGTPLTHDLFDPESFFSGLEVHTEANISLTNPKLRFAAKFEPGPLFALVDGGIEFDGVLPTDASLRLRTELVAVQIITRQSYQFLPPNERDELSVVLDTTPVPLANLRGVTEDGGIGLVMTGTHIHSESYALDQVFTDATFMMHTVEGDRYVIGGAYSAVATKKDLVLYHAGLVDTIAGNSVQIYCDEGHTEPVGHAVHRADLRGGTFQHVSGKSFEYHLREVPSLEARTRG